VAEKVEIIVTAQDKASGVLGNIAGAFTKTGLGLTAGVTAPLVALGAKAVGAASDLAEATNALNTVFGDAAGGVLAFGQTAAQSVGLANAEFNQLAAVSGALLQNLGFEANAAGTEVITLAQRAADMASVFNTDVDQAMAAVNSALKGEFNPLEQFGVKLNAADIAAKALELGLADTAAELDNNAKAQAALAIIYEQTDRIAGDFINTSDGLANSQRILAAQMEDVSAQLGAVLIPYVQQFVGWVTGLLDKFQGLSPEMQRFAVIGGGIVAALGPLFLIIGALISAFSAIIPVVVAVAGVLSGPVLLVIAAVAAGIALLALAWKTNFLGIRDAVMNFWQGTLQPAFQSIYEWMQVNIPLALAALANYWKTVLLPAIQEVWSFIQVNVVPLLEVLGKILGFVLTQALNNFANAWNVVLKPALQAMWEFIQDKIMPLLKKLKKDIVDPLVRSLADGLGKTLQWLTTMLEDFSEALDNLKVPKLFTPGSPTPFEMGLRGINKELSSIARTSLPSFSVGMAGLGASSSLAAVPATGGTAVNVYFSYQGVSLGDRVEAERVLAPVVGKLVRDNIEALN
jgi:hypothetical protein